MRIVVYAEGPAETRGGFGLRPKPGDELAGEYLGAAHVLVRRVIEAVAPARLADLRFDEPMRTHTGREIVGSDLRSRKIIRPALQPALPHLRPNLAVIVVDEDGDERRRFSVEQCVEGLPWPVIVVGVAVREFESWLITDSASIAKHIDQAIPTPPSPESMKPREAKALLQRWLAAYGDGRDVRRALAESIDIGLLARNSTSFCRFRDELSDKLQLVP